MKKKLLIAALLCMAIQHIHASGTTTPRPPKDIDQPAPQTPQAVRDSIAALDLDGDGRVHQPQHPSQVAQTDINALATKLKQEARKHFMPHFESILWVNIWLHIVQINDFSNSQCMRPHPGSQHEKLNIAINSFFAQFLRENQVSIDQLLTALLIVIDWTKQTPDEQTLFLYLYYYVAHKYLPEENRTLDYAEDLWKRYEQGLVWIIFESIRK